MHDKTKPVTNISEEAREACSGIDDDEAREICERAFLEGASFEEDGEIQDEGNVEDEIVRYFSGMEIYQVVSDGCGHCASQKPISDKMAKKGVPIMNIGIDEAEEMGFDELVTGFPARIYVCNGEPIFVGGGFMEDDDLKGEFEKGLLVCRTSNGRRRN